MSHTSIALKTLVRQYLHKKWNSGDSNGYDIVQVSILNHDDSIVHAQYKAIHYTVRSSDDREYIDITINKSEL